MFLKLLDILVQSNLVRNYPSYFPSLLLPNNTSNIPTPNPPRHRLTHNPQHNIPLKHNNRPIILHAHRNQISRLTQRKMSREHSSCRPELDMI
jgi:hypothetical protein